MGEETEAIQKKLGEANSCLSDLGYHVSVGVYQENVPVEIDRLIKQAESNKYEEKRDMITKRIWTGDADSALVFSGRPLS